jgi:hypothetical protein
MWMNGGDFKPLNNATRSQTCGKQLFDAQA